jgi:hypothetical protein
MKKNKTLYLLVKVTAPAFAKPEDVRRVIRDRINFDKPFIRAKKVAPLTLRQIQKENYQNDHYPRGTETKFKD